jgi:hypothetical protein
MTDHTRHHEPEQGLLEIGAGEVVAASRNLLQRSPRAIAERSERQ